MIHGSTCLTLPSQKPAAQLRLKYEIPRYETTREHVAPVPYIHYQLWKTIHDLRNINLYRTGLARSFCGKLFGGRFALVAIITRVFKYASQS
ncbi:Hypothetical predicted protein [Octopus vulgaris]|uniref:Uncharacterized protein n=1 Tax=Octopus vulgaris TaxID=6645 RepID=A0AA36BPA0_OCTVU|nr:Hypothetical predicted protein [Octopus vulgaris]